MDDKPKRLPKKPGSKPGEKSPWEVAAKRNGGKKRPEISYYETARNKNVKGDFRITPTLRQAYVLHLMGYSSSQIGSIYDVTDRCVQAWISKIRSSGEFETGTIPGEELASHSLQTLIPMALARYRGILENGADKEALVVATNILKSFNTVRDKREVTVSRDFTNATDAELIAEAEAIIAGLSGTLDGTEH